MAGPHPSAIVVDAGGLAPDIVTVDALARLRLAALRAGRKVRLRNATSELCDLIAFAGLAEALPVEPGGEPEQREQGLGVEEERQLGDPAA